MSDFFLMTEKAGMTQILLNGEVIAVTLLQVKRHDVFALKTKSKDGYNAICFSAGSEIPERKVTKPMLTQFKAKSLQPRQEIFEYRLDSDVQNFTVEGAEVSLEEYIPTLINSKIDAKGVSSGKGFAGVMKRWNFRGLEATHGVSVSHRSHGSTGQRQDPGKVFKGKKMAGHLGNESVTVQNLSLVFFDKELGLIGVKGAVPGRNKSLVFIQNAVKMANEGIVENVNGLKIIYS
jgi:large subunit ribosomal protein L3